MTAMQLPYTSDASETLQNFYAFDSSLRLVPYPTLLSYVQESNMTCS